jgi:hypothetical protein
MLMRAAGATVHPCHFYSDDASLVSNVGTFLAPAFREGHAMVMFGTPTHLAAIEKRLRAERYDVDSARSSGQYQVFDAQAALDALLVGELPAARVRRRSSIR